MAEFNPDQYLQGPGPEFSPDDYLSQEPTQEFDPDLYTAEEEGLIVPTEVQNIAKRHNVSEDFLRDWVPRYGGRMSDVEATDPTQIVKSSIGFLGEAVTGGFAQFVAKKALADEKQEKALDDLRELVNERKSGIQQAAEIVGGIGTGVGIARGIGKGAAKVAAQRGLAAPAARQLERGAEAAAAAAEGVAAGLGRARAGEELEAAAIGAAAGYGLAKGAQLLGNVITKKAAQKAAQKAPEEVQDLADAVRKEYTQNQSYYDDVADALTRQSDEVTETMIQRHSDDAQKLMDDPEMEGVSRIVEGAEDSQEVARRLAKEEYVNQQKDFARFLTDKSVDEKMGLREARRIISREANKDPEFYAKKAKDFAESIAVDKALSAKVMRAIPRTSYAIRRTALALMDGKYSSRFIDEDLGLRTEVIMDRASRDNRLYQTKLMEEMGELKKISQKAEAVDSKKVIEAIEENKLDILSEDELEVADFFRNTWARYRDEANRMGIKVQELGAQAAKKGGYVPHHMVPLPEAIARLNQRIDQLSGDLDIDIRGELSDVIFSKLSKNSDFKELRAGLEQVSGMKINNAESFMKSLLDSTDAVVASGRIRDYAGAMMQRTGDIPKFLRESNLNRLTMNWASDTFKQGYMRNHIQELRKAALVAEKAGRRADAEWLRNTASDMIGMRPNTLATWTTRQKLRFESRLRTEAKSVRDRGGSGIHANALEFIAENPNAMHAMLQQVYPNFLGANPRAVIRNLTQNLTMTIPELATGRGAMYVLRGYLKTALAPMTGKKIVVKSDEMAKKLSERLGKSVQRGEEVTVKNMQDILENEGLVGPEWNTEMKSWVNSGYRTGIKSAGLKVPVEVMRKASDAAMYFYTKSDTINRMIAADTAEMIARDYFRGGAARRHTEAFLNKLPSGYRKELTELAETDPQKFIDETRNYLVSKTQFNYDRIQLAEVGRTLGPIFTVFTKWPISISSDIAYILKKEGIPKGTLKASVKYGAYWAALDMAHNVLLPNAERDDRVKKLVGAGGLASWAPILSVESVISGDIMKPPIIDVVTKGAVDAVSLDPSRWWKSLNRTVQAFAPGSWMYRVLTDDVPTLRTGRRPEGTFVGKGLPSVDREIENKSERVQRMIERLKR